MRWLFLTLLFCVSPGAFAARSCEKIVLPRSPERLRALRRLFSKNHEVLDVSGNWALTYDQDVRDGRRLDRLRLVQLATGRRRELYREDPRRPELLNTRVGPAASLSPTHAFYWEVTRDDDPNPPDLVLVSQDLASGEQKRLSLSYLLAHQVQLPDEAILTLKSFDSDEKNVYSRLGLVWSEEGSKMQMDFLVTVSAKTLVPRGLANASRVPVSVSDQKLFPEKSFLFRAGNCHQEGVVVTRDDDYVYTCLPGPRDWTLAKADFEGKIAGHLKPRDFSSAAFFFAEDGMLHIHHPSRGVYRVIDTERDFRDGLPED